MSEHLRDLKIRLVATNDALYEQFDCSVIDYGHADHSINIECEEFNRLRAEIAALKANLEEKDGEIESWKRIVDDALKRAHSREDWQAIAERLAEALSGVHPEYAPIEAEQTLAAYSDLLNGKPRE